MGRCAQTRHVDHAGHADAVVSNVGRTEMDVYPPPWTRAARTIQVITQLIIRRALENRSWGYTRIQGALANLGHDVGRGTIANVLSEHSIDPAPERGKRTSWSTFLKEHWDSIAATDFFTVEVLMLRCLVTYYILFVLDLASRTEDCGNHLSSGRSLDDADGAQSHRCRGAVPSAHTVPNHGSRYQIFRSLPRGAGSGADRADHQI